MRVNKSDSMKRYILLFTLMALLYGCSQAAEPQQTAPTAPTKTVATTTTPAQSTESAPTAEPKKVGVTEEAVRKSSSQQTVQQPEKTISMTAKQWSFSPDPVTVDKGDNVILKVKSIDVAHGFALPDFGVSEYLEPGKEVVVAFVADKAGTFDFYCNVRCGSGHSSMRGKLIVK